MSGVVLGEIREGLAAQIKSYIARPTNVWPRRQDTYEFPAITLLAPVDEYVSYFATFGANGVADIFLDAEIEIAGSLIDAQIAMDDYLSIGTGNGSSIVDAIHSDRTIGGLVADCVCLTTGGPNLEVDPISARLRIQIRLHKIGAQV